MFVEKNLKCKKLKVYLFLVFSLESIRISNKNSDWILDPIRYNGIFVLRIAEWVLAFWSEFVDPDWNIFVFSLCLYLVEVLHGCASLVSLECNCSIASLLPPRNAYPIEYLRDEFVGTFIAKVVLTWQVRIQILLWRSWELWKWRSYHSSSILHSGGQRIAAH